MLTADVERYVHLRQILGFKLRDASRLLRAFAGFAVARGDTHLRESTAVDWAAEAPSPNARHIRLRIVTNLARFLHAIHCGFELVGRHGSEAGHVLSDQIS